MDEYGCIEINQQDANWVRAVLDEKGAVVFGLNISEGTLFNFCITKKFEKLGIVCNGGSPTGRVYVSVQGISANHFAMQETHADYFAQKLRLGPQEAKGFAEFWKLMWAL